MSKKNNKQPHDRFFKMLFSKRSVAQHYINQFMPKSITEKLDLRTLKIAKDTFIDENLKDHFSDIVYTCNWQKEGNKKKQQVKVCLLLEHKSNPSKYPHFQLLRYIVNSWDNDLAQNRKPRIVVPIILYHGKQKWKVKNINNYFDVTPDSPFFQYLPKFDYHLTDLSHYSDKEILNLSGNFLINGLILLKHKRDREYLLKNIEIVFIHIELYQDEEGKSFVKSMFIYIFDAFGLTQQLINELIEEIKKTKPMAHITFDKFMETKRKEGEVIGIKKEKENSRKKQIAAQIAVIENILRKFPNLTNLEIAQIAQADVQMVLKIREQIK